MVVSFVSSLPSKFAQKPLVERQQKPALLVPSKKAIIYKKPKLLLRAELIDETYLNFAEVQTRGQKRVVAVVQDYFFSTDAKKYPGSFEDALLKLARIDYGFYNYNHGLLKKVLQDPKKEQKFLQFILAKDNSGSPRICTLNRDSTLEALTLLKKNNKSVNFSDPTPKGETLFTRWTRKGDFGITKTILDMDPTAIQQLKDRNPSVFEQAISKGNHKLLNLLATAIKKQKVSLTLEETYLLKAATKQPFSDGELETFKQKLKQKIYYVANAFSNVQLVVQLRNNRIASKPLFYSEREIFALNMNVVTVTTVMKGFLKDLRSKGLLLTEEEFSKLDKSKYIAKSDQIGRIQGRNFIEQTARRFNLKHIKVPRKIVVVKSGTSQLSFQLSPFLEILPKGNDNQVTIYAERVEDSNRKLSLEEAIEYMIIIEKTGYSDFIGQNIFFSEDGIYFVDTEYLNFAPNNPPWTIIKTIKDLIDPQDVKTFMTEFRKRKANFDNEKEKREKHQKRFKGVFKNPYRNLVEGYRRNELKFPLSNLLKKCSKN